MKLHRHQEDLRRALAAEQGRLGLVPTMGALHAGHLSLIQNAKEANDRVAVSIFVNPLQFGAGEDLFNYPRTEEEDLEMLGDMGIDHVLLGEPEDFYADGFCTTIEIQGEVAQALEGERRPGHFNGVCTVVAKLFHLFEPDTAYFGWKDFQQVCVLRRMVVDLAFPVEIHACPIHREEDGLAMSSRNRYLSPEHRAKAGGIYAALQEAREGAQQGLQPPVLCDGVQRRLAEDFAVEYVQVRDEADFGLVETLEPSGSRARMLVVANLGGVRLLDNLRLLDQ